jgi:hypothetical protein
MEATAADAIDVAPTAPTAPMATTKPIAGDMAKPKAKVKKLTAAEREF